MNRSFSKIRHIQEANLMMENRILEEKSRHLLMEGVDDNTPDITISLPYVLNQKDQTKQYKTDNSRAKFIISAQKTPDGNFNTASYGPIKSISVDGVGPVPNTTMSAPMNTSDGSIKGSFVLTQDLYNKLQEYLGKGWQHGSQKVIVNTGEGKYASFQVNDYNMTPTQK